MSVTGSARSFGAFDNSGSGGIEGLASGVVVTVYLEHSVEIAFGGPCPSLLPCFYRWGNLVPIHTFSAFGAVAALEVASSWGCGSIFMGGLK